MKNIINVKDFCEYAMAEEDGIKLREQIAQYLEKEEKVTIDFEDIELFATPFFNSSIGYFCYTQLEKFEKLVEVVNLSELGKRTYTHSVENAKRKKEEKDPEIIGRITQETIEEE